jgi:hypothetical protein
MKTGIKLDAERDVKSGEEKNIIPSRQGKIIPTQTKAEVLPSLPRVDPEKPEWSFSKVSKIADPNSVISIESIPDLFRSIERIMQGLLTLNAEFCLSGERIPEVWLVPVYMPKEKRVRREISFDDAAKLVVIVAAFNGEIKEMRFLDEKK